MREDHEDLEEEDVALIPAHESESDDDIHIAEAGIEATEAGAAREAVEPELIDLQPANASDAEEPDDRSEPQEEEDFQVIRPGDAIPMDSLLAPLLASNLTGLIRQFLAQMQWLEEDLQAAHIRPHELHHLLMMHTRWSSYFIRLLAFDDHVEKTILYPQLQSSAIENREESDRLPRQGWQRIGRNPKHS